MKKLILTFGIAVLAVGFLAAQTFVGTEPARISLVAQDDAEGDNLIVQSTQANGRTQLRVSPKGSDSRAFIEALNSANLNNTGLARLGARGSFGIISAINVGTPATRLKNVAIELDPNATESGEAFVVSTGGFLDLAFGPEETILLKVNENGLTETKEVQVKANLAAPDYVFEESYDLPTIEEVETYIKENKHLPQMPSAADFQEDGINLGNMAFDLLKQIEHQQLYIIELNKQVKALKAEIATMKEND